MSLRDHLTIAAIFLWPGYVATERMTQLVDTDSGVKQLKEKMGFERTELSGRVIRVLIGLQILDADPPA